MDITMFDVKLNALTTTSMRHNNKDFVSLDHLKQTFCTTQAWNELWSNMEGLLRTSAFKELHPEKDKQLAESEYYVAKLDISILALLSCQGEQSEKAKYLCNLVNSGNDDSVAWDE